MRAPETIIVSTDFSNVSKLAMAGARVLAQGGTPRIILAHVLDVKPLDEGQVEAYSTLQQALETNAHGELDKLREEEFGNADNVTTALLRDRSVPDALCRLAKDEDADVIVISTHGRTGLKHLLIGSVAERVVRYAPCPVFTLRSKQRD